MPIIKVYCTEAEKKRVSSTAQKLGVSESKIVRDAIRDQLRNDKPKPGN